MASATVVQRRLWQGGMMIATKNGDNNNATADGVEGTN